MKVLANKESSFLIFCVFTKNCWHICSILFSVVSLSKKCENNINPVFRTSVQCRQFIMIFIFHIYRYVYVYRDWLLWSMLTQKWINDNQLWREINILSPLFYFTFLCLVPYHRRSEYVWMCRSIIAHCLFVSPHPSYFPKTAL